MEKLKTKLFLASVHKPAACFGIYRWPWLWGSWADAHGCAGTSGGCGSEEGALLSSH